MSTVDPTHVIREWELKHLPFSLANGEIGVNGKVIRSVIMSRYTSQIERMFNTQVRSLISRNIISVNTFFQVTIRKPSRELTYIEEEEEERLPEIKVVTNTRASRIQEEEAEDKNKEEANEKLTEDRNDAIKADPKAHNVTVVNLEHTDTLDKESSERVTVVKDHDRHVRFTSKVEEIDFKEIDEVNEKTS